MKSKGALIFARNNAQIDYIKQAHYSAKRIKKFLNIPTSIVTDSVDYLKETYKDYEKVFEDIKSSRGITEIPTYSPTFGN